MVSLFRLYLLRAAYLLIVVGLGLMIWPKLLNPPQNVEHMRGVVWALLGTVGVLAAFGLRYPLRMLPVLLFELVWKTTWLVAIGLPHWMNNTFTAATASTWNDNVFGIALCLVVIPWRYVWTHYVKQAGDPWSAEKRAPAHYDAGVQAPMI